MQNFLEKLLEGNKIKTIAGGIVVLAIIVSIIMLSGGNKEKTFIENGQFNLAEYSQKIAAEYGLSQNEELIQVNDTAYKDYGRDSSKNMTTDVVANLMYASAYMTDKGLTATNTQVAIMAKLTENYLANFKDEEYKVSDLKIIDSPSNDDLKSFSENTFAVLNNYYAELKSSDREEGFISANKNAERALLSASVPSDIAGEYLNLVNAFYRNVAYLHAIKNAEEDPLKLQAFKEYTPEKNINMLKSATVNINTYLNKN